MKLFSALLLFGCCLPCHSDEPTTASGGKNLFARKNLVAWCIVPFDAKDRSPKERAEMLVRLGLKHVAYDWRAKHVQEFEDEILQYKEHGLNYFAFWDWHPSMEPLIRKHKIKPQIWKMMRNSTRATQEEKVKDAAEGLLPMVELTESLGLKLGIYNHGGWAGQPENMIAVAKYLRENHKAEHVGLVYNFHHGHEHMENFDSLMKQMKPWLHCLNINGMDDAAAVAADGNRKILDIGSGRHEIAMLKTVRDSGYDGRIGILDHRTQLDAEVSLKANMDGLRKLVRKNLK